MVDEIPLLQCYLQNETALYNAYMPFVKGCGIFIRTPHVYSLGTTIKVTITFPDESIPASVLAKVVWITPRGAQGGKPAGLGVRFVDDTSRELINKIENVLAGMLKSTQPNDTM